MNDHIAKLIAGGPVVTDGAWGTQMQARGRASGECPDGWNLSHADIVERIPRAYVDAGSRVVLANTFRGNRLVASMLEGGGFDVTDFRADLRIAKRRVRRHARQTHSVLFACTSRSQRVVQHRHAVKVACLAKQFAPPVEHWLDIVVAKLRCLHDAPFEWLVVAADEFEIDADGYPSHRIASLSLRTVANAPLDALWMAGLLVARLHATGSAGAYYANASLAGRLAPIRIQSQTWIILATVVGNLWTTPPISQL